MFKKLINHGEGSQVEMNDPALQDIIPSNEVIIPKKPRQKQFSSICKILILIFILGLVAIGIVLLGLILAYSGKSFMNFLIQSSKTNLLSISNKTQVPTFHKNNLPSTSDEQEWKKLTVIPINNNQQISKLSSIISTKQENKHTSINTQSMKSYSSLNTMINEQSTSTTIQTTIKNQEYVQTSQENRITTIDIFTSTFFIQKLRDYETTTLKNIPLTTQIDLQSSTNKNKKKITLVKYKKLEQDNVIDDLLFS